MTSPFCRKKLFFKEDVSRCISENRQALILSLVISLLGIGFGVLVAVKLGERESPYCVFAKLFRLSFRPFSFVFPYFLRFSLFVLLAAVGFFLPFSQAFPILAFFFYAKFIGQTAALCFLTDALVSSLLSLLIIYIPLFAIGFFCLFFLFVRISEMKLCHGIPFDRKSLSSVLRYVLTPIIVYFLTLILLFVFLCGVIYLIAFLA